jgi:hypothetical protein
MGDCTFVGKSVQWANHTGGTFLGIEQFDEALMQLGWKVSGFCRQTGLHRNTPGRWRNEGVPIPLWVEKYLEMALEVKRLHDRFIVPSKEAPDA